MTAPNLNGRPTVDQVLPWVLDYYVQPGNEMGGSLHIVLDDENLHRGHIEWCRDYARREGDVFGEWLAGILLQLTMSQLRRLVDRTSRALYDLEYS